MRASPSLQSLQTRHTASTFIKQLFVKKILKFWYLSCFPSIVSTIRLDSARLYITGRLARPFASSIGQHRSCVCIYIHVVAYYKRLVSSFFLRWRKKRKQDGYKDTKTGYVIKQTCCEGDCTSKSTRSPRRGLGVSVDLAMMGTLGDGVSRLRAERMPPCACW